MPDRVNDRPDELRRKLLKSSALLGGAFAAAHTMPYVKPGSKGFEGIPSAYAMLSPGTLTIPSCTAEDLLAAAGEVTQDGLVTNITATVAPIPAVGTQVDCTPTSTDPLNPTGNVTVAGTDAAGVATFPDFNMTSDWPAPLVAIGSGVEFTFTFVDPACGPDSCVTNLVVVGPVGPPVDVLTGIARGLDPPNALHVRGALFLQATAFEADGVTPIPNARVRVTIKTNDPNPANREASVSPMDVVTDAAGEANYPPVRMARDFATNLAIGTLVTCEFSARSRVSGMPIVFTAPALPVVP